MAQDRGLIQRGLLVLALMSALVVVVLTIMFQRPATPLPPFADRPELAAALLVRSDASFPASVSWPGLYQLGEAFPSAPGWLIRYNATTTLARRGAPNLPWNVILEMLDEHRQLRNFRVQLQDGKVVADESAARLTMINALRAVADWHKKQGNDKRNVSADMAQVYASIDKLVNNPTIEIRTQAEYTRKVFFR